MDGVLAGSTAQFQKWYGRDFELELTLEALRGKLDKYQWLQTHFLFIHWRNFVFCGDQSVLNADCLIDDNACNFDGFRGRAYCLLPRTMPPKPATAAGAAGKR